MQVSQVCRVASTSWAVSTFSRDPSLRVLSQEQSRGHRPAAAARVWTRLLKMALRWTGEVIPAASLGESKRELGRPAPWQEAEIYLERCQPRGPVQTVLCGVMGSRLQETAFSGFLLSLAFTSPWHQPAQAVLCRTCLGPPSRSYPSVPVRSRAMACPSGLACIFHMCCPGQFPPSAKSFSSRHKSNGGNKCTKQNPHSFSAWICVGWE